MNFADLDRPFAAPFVGFIVLLFVLYRLLVKQREAKIDVLQARIDAQSERIKELSNQTPDALVSILSVRVEKTLEEIERLKNDGAVYQTEIAEREQALSALKASLQSVRELIKETDLVCPHCEAPLVGRHARTIYGEYDGREVDAEIEYSWYECGFETEDGRPFRACANAASATP